MEKMEKTSAELSRLLDDRLAGWDCQGRSMFGGRAYFINGNMFAGTHGSQLSIRLSEADRAEFLAAYPDASIFEPRPGHRMNEYVAAPPSLLTDTETLDAWLKRSLDFTRHLPAKESKSRQKKPR